MHHRKEITENKSREELIEENQYFNVSPDDLIFLTASEHIRMHNKGSKKPHSQQTKNKMRKAHKPLSNDTKEKMSEAKKHKTKTDEHKANIGKSMKGNKKRAVFQFDSDKHFFLGVYFSAGEAERATGVKKANILAVCKGRTHTAGGFCWEFADE